MTHVVLLLLGILTFDLMNLVSKTHSVVWSVVVFWPPLLCPCMMKITTANRALTPSRPNECSGHFTLSNARRFYSSMGNLSDRKGLMFLTREFLTNPVCQIDVLDFLRQVITKKKAGKIDMFSTNLLVFF